MTAKERYIKITVCPWCGISDSKSLLIDLLGHILCGGCGCIYRSFGFFRVPERSIGLRNINADKMLHLPSSVSHAFFTGHSFVKEEDCVRITVCPWCGSSITNQKPSIFGKSDCKDCGTKYQSDIHSWMVPKRSIGSKGENADELIENKEKWAIMGSSATVCPWCGHAEGGKMGRMTKCKKCGTNYALMWINIKEPCALDMKNQNKDINNI